MEAFSTFMLVLSLYFPHRWKDLSQYQLPILQTQHQFPSRVWLPLPIWSTGPALTFSFSTSTWLVPQSVDRVMSPLAPRSLAVLALRESCAGRGTGDSAPHLVRPAGLPIIVPAVLGLTVPHPALVFHLTSPKPIPSGGRPLPSPCELVAN